MGTNYYRIPKSSDVIIKQQKLNISLEQMDWRNPLLAMNSFRNIEDPDDEWANMSPWDEFTKDLSVHLGKRSMGWKFSWNFHNDKYYSNKDELLKFIRSGRVVDEYGTQIDVEEFIEMALNWCVDGWDTEKYYKETPESRVSWIDYSKHFDRYVDGLRVSSSTDFC